MIVLVYVPESMAVGLYGMYKLFLESEGGTTLPVVSYEDSVMKIAVAPVVSMDEVVDPVVTVALATSVIPLPPALFLRFAATMPARGAAADDGETRENSDATSSAVTDQRRMRVRRMLGDEVARGHPCVRGGLHDGIDRILAGCFDR